MMEKQIKQEFYASPELEVIETQMQTLICQSGGINNMGFGSNQGDGDFN